MNNPLETISHTDLLRLKKCVDNHFSQLHKEGVLVYGESSEENHRFMKMYGDIMNYYWKNPDSTIPQSNSQEMAQHNIEKKIKELQ